jgi:S-adenosylmethionine decarboxylase
MNTSMKNIAPDVFRQRLLLEGFWTIKVDEENVRRYLLDLAAHLGLRTYGDPVIFSPSSGMGREENAGYDAFVPLIDSGISGYFWSKQKFFSIVIYTCKGFDEDAAATFTRQFFNATDESVRFGF